MQNVLLECNRKLGSQNCTNEESIKAPLQHLNFQLHVEALHGIDFRFLKSTGHFTLFKTLLKH